MNKDIIRDLDSLEIFVNKNTKQISITYDKRLKMFIRNLYVLKFKNKLYYSDFNFCRYEIYYRTSFYTRLFDTTYINDFNSYYKYYCKINKLNITKYIFFFEGYLYINELLYYLYFICSKYYSINNTLKLYDIYGNYEQIKLYKKKLFNCCDFNKSFSFIYN